MSTTKPNDGQKGSQPPFGEILSSDMVSAYLGYAHNMSIAGINVLDPTSVWIQMMWDPWLSMVVFRDMEEKDDAIFSSLDTRKDGVLAKSRRVLPASDKLRDRKIAEFIEETLEQYTNQITEPEEAYDGLDQVLFEMLDAVGKGVSIGEIIWGDGGDRVYVSDVKFHPQHLFSFGEGMEVYSTPSYLGIQTGPLRLRTPISIAGVGENGLLPTRKFLVGTYRPQYSNRWGSPLLRKCFWVSWFKRSAIKQWLRYLEKGSGSVVSRYVDSASADEKQKALSAARAVNEESAVAIPTKFQIEVLEHVRQSLGTSFEGLTDGQCNNAIMRVILGQTLTSRGSEGGGSRALGDVHNQVRAEKIEADAKFLMAVVNRCLVRPLTLFNFGPAVRPPRWVIEYDPKRDTSAESVVDERLVGMGLPVAKKFFYEKYNVPEPSEGEELLELPESATKAGTPSTGVDPAADFAEKKTSASGKKLNSKPGSKIARFSKLR